MRFSGACWVKWSHYYSIPFVPRTFPSGFDQLGANRSSFFAASVMSVVSSTATHLNTEHLTSLADDDVEFLEELWQCFEEEYVSSLEKLKSATEGKEKDSAVLNAHNIKSGSANLGAERMREISAGLEMAAKKEDFDTISVSLDNLQEAYKELSATFSEWLTSLE